MHYITRIRPPPPSPPPPPRARRMRLHEQRCGAARSRSSETHLRINSYLIGALRRARVGSSISPGNPGRSLVCTASVERGDFHPIAMDRGILTLFARGRIVRSMAATTVGRKSLRTCVCVCVCSARNLHIKAPVECYAGEIYVSRNRWKRVSRAEI